MRGIFKVYTLTLGIGAVAMVAYQVGRQDRETGVHRTLVPSLYAADANTFVGLEAGTLLPQQSPTGTVQDRDVYYPGTEALAPDEMRVTACGTGMPNARPKQAAACWLVELGNGDKFLFDIGTGSAERISALKIPYDYLDKVFVGHLHSDHFGDLDASGLVVSLVTGSHRSKFGARAVRRTSTARPTRSNTSRVATRAT